MKLSSALILRCSLSTEHCLYATFSLFFLQVSKHHQAVFSQSWWCDCDVWNNLSGKFHSCQTVADKCQGKTIINSAGGTCRCYFVCFSSDSITNYKAIIFVQWNKENIVHFFDRFKKSVSLEFFYLFFYFVIYLFYNLLQESAGEDIPIMLLGNKTDKETEREVQKEVGERLAKVCLFFQISSQFNVGFYKWMEPTK